MGKASKRRKNNKTTRKSTDPLAGALKRKETVVTLVKQLDNPDAAARLEACVMIANLFAQHETEDEQGAVYGQHFGEIVDVLVHNKAFPVLMKRVSDADDQVRRHACGALCTIAAAWRPACELLADSGVHIAAIALVRDATANLPRVETPETVVLALEVLCNLSNSSKKATKILADDVLMERLCQLTQLGAVQDLSNAVDIAEHAAKLLHTITEGNRSIASRVAQNPRIECLIKTVQDFPTSHSANAALHCTGALISVSYLANRPDLLDPNEICLKLFDVVMHVMESGPSEDLVTESLAFEILTNCCSESYDEEEDLVKEEEKTFEIDVIRNTCTKLIEHPLMKSIAQVISLTESDITTPFAEKVGTRACALLDNLVQSAPRKSLDILGLQDLFQSSWRLLGLSVTEGNENNSTEELIDVVSALIWTITRRALSKTEPVPLSLSQDHLAGLFATAQTSIATNARMNLVGVFGCIAGSLPSTLNEQDFQKLIHALISCAADASLQVSVQAIDSLIDIFADDDLDPAFRQLKVDATMKSVLPRFRASLEDQNLLIDRDALEEVTENLVGFLKYKGI